MQEKHEYDSERWKEVKEVGGVTDSVDAILQNKA